MTMASTLPSKWVHVWLKPLYDWLKNDVAPAIDTPTPTTLTAGAHTNKLYYSGDGAAWMKIDGSNPPTFSIIRLIDQTTGLPIKVGVTGGTLAIIA